mmetsp:Transcript_33634/g.99727  ORF Transcript_33634/g.99727 Transcript_33634/m.99727 type:complete len:220 (+) Transcript_33634:853-1512(+)
MRRRARPPLRAPRWPTHSRTSTRRPATLRPSSAPRSSASSDPTHAPPDEASRCSLPPCVAGRRASPRCLPTTCRRSWRPASRRQRRPPPPPPPRTRPPRPSLGWCRYVRSRTPRRCSVSASLSARVGWRRRGAALRAPAGRRSCCRLSAPSSSCPERRARRRAAGTGRRATRRGMGAPPRGTREPSWSTLVGSAACAEGSAAACAEGSDEAVYYVARAP